MGLKKVLAGTLVAGVLSLGLVSTAMAVPVTLDFSGTLEDGGSVSGWFTYDNAVPNFHNDPTGSAWFPLTSWSFDVFPGTQSNQPHTVQDPSTELGDVTQYVGRISQNSSGDITLVRLFRHQGPAPFTILTLRWGPMSASHYRVFDGPGPSGNTITNLQIQSGSLSASPIPEPSTILLLGTGLVGLAVWRQKKRRTV